MMIPYLGWYLIVIQNNSDYFPLFLNKYLMSNFKQSKPFVKYSIYCSAWKERDNCQKKDKSLIHWEGKQKTATNKQTNKQTKNFTLISSPST